MPSVPSLALGSGEVTLFDMTVGLRRVRQRRACGTRRSYITRVEDAEGNVLYRRRRDGVAAVIAGRPRS